MHIIFPEIHRWAEYHTIVKVVLMPRCPMKLKLGGLASGLESLGTPFKARPEKDTAGTRRDLAQILVR